MAVTKIKKVHCSKSKSAGANISDCINYVLNPDKTEECKLVNSFGCDYHTADIEFLMLYNQYIAQHGKRNINDVLAYHMIQSFSPGEVSPEDANKIGYETASRLLGGKYDFIVATHVDKLHIHNHIIWSSVSNDLSQKYVDVKDSYKVIREISDNVCTEHELSVIINPTGHNQTYREWLEGQKNRPQLLVDINKALQEKGQGYRMWAAKHNVQQLAQAYNFMKNNKIKSADEIDDVINRNSNDIAELKSIIASSQKRLDNVIAMKTHLINYSKYKDIYVKYKNSGYSKKVYEENKEAIDLVKAAKEIFASYGDDTLPTVKDLNAIIKQIQSDKNDAYGRLKSLSAENADLKKYAENIRTLLSEPEPVRERTRTKTRQNER